MTREMVNAAFRGGPPVFGMSLRYTDPALLEMIGADWDFVWVDAQHGTFELHDLAALARVADLVGTALLVRVGRNLDFAARILDLDVAGVVLAQVEDEAAAKAAAWHLRYPPTGDRSFGGRRMIDRRGVMHTQLDDQLVICQIESVAAVGLADAIAAIAGIDGLMPGPDDLRLRRDASDPEVADLVLVTGQAARASGKGWLGIASSLSAEQLLSAGATAISLTSDHQMVRDGSREALAHAQRLRARLSSSA